MARIILFSIFFLVGQIALAQSQKAELPYRIVSNKILVDVEIEGKAYPFIFDTGGTAAIIDSIADLLGLEHEGDLNVTDATGTRLNYQKCVVKEMHLPKSNITITNYSFLSLPTPSPVQQFGAVGLLGSDLWQNHIVRFDPSRQVITITSAEHPVDADTAFRMPFSPNGQIWPIISLPIGTQEVDAMFDSGAYYLLSLKETDYYKLYSWQQTKLLERGFGKGSSGIGGTALLPHRKEVKRIRVAPIRMGAATLSNVISEDITPASHTLVGMRLLEYGEVIIDYSRREFYFLPFKTNIRVEQKFNNVGFNITDKQLCINAIWGEELRNKIKIGSPVIAINGKLSGEYDLMGILKNGLPAITGKKKNTITVQTKDGELVLPYETRSYK